MAIKSWPYVSVEGDRKITAGDEALGYDLFAESGIVPDYLDEFIPAKVAGAMNVSVGTGAAVIAGHRMINDAAASVTLSAGGAQPRIDIVVAESNANTSVRACRFAVVEGTPGAAPEVPTLTESAALWQIPLATVSVPAGALTLDSATITDSRVYTQGRHEHAATTITGLQAALDGKAAASHTHAISAITGLQAALDGKQSTLDADRVRKVTISTSSPSGGSDGDIWLKYS